LGPGSCLAIKQDRLFVRADPCFLDFQALLLQFSVEHWALSGWMLYRPGEHPCVDMPAAFSSAGRLSPASVGSGLLRQSSMVLPWLIACKWTDVPRGRLFPIYRRLAFFPIVF
jgi:hypothetical protein